MFVLSVWLRVLDMDPNWKLAQGHTEILFSNLRLVFFLRTLASCFLLLPGPETRSPCSALLPFWGEGSPTKTDYRKNIKRTVGTLILTSLEDLAKAGLLEEAAGDSVALARTLGFPPVPRPRGGPCSRRARTRPGGSCPAPRHRAGAAGARVGGFGGGVPGGNRIWAKINAGHVYWGGPRVKPLDGEPRSPKMPQITSNFKEIRCLKNATFGQVKCDLESQNVASESVPLIYLGS